MDNFKLQNIKSEFEEEYLDLMIQFLTELDIDMLSEEKQVQYYEIMDMLAEEEELDDECCEPEVMEARLKRHIKKSDKNKRKREYRKNKGKLKRAAKKMRKTSSFKKKMKKSKRMGKRNLTGTGKRRTTFT